MALEVKKLVVCGIDVGTSNSGSCFRLLQDKRCAIQNTLSGMSDIRKIPTCFLLDKTLTNLIHFGSQAELRYKPGENALFRCFKMQLYTNEFLSETPVVISACRQYTLRADVAFRFALSYFMNELKTTVERWHKNLNWREVLWVLTIPAIWSDGARQVMQNAAVGAGLHLDDVYFAQEPLAASLDLAHNGQCRVTQPGTVVLTVDCGGGTIDLSMHKVGARETIEILQCASGTDAGGTFVNQRYLAILKEAFGEFYAVWEQENPRDVVDVDSDFEQQKLIWDGTDSLMVSPGPLIDSVAESDMTAVVDKLNAMGITRLKKRLIFPVEVARQLLFVDSVNATISLIREQLSKYKGKVDVVAVVGGFSRSKYLFSEIKKHFEECDPVGPPNPDIAIVTGAVLYGTQLATGQPLVRNTIMNRCWGIKIRKAYNPQDHKEETKFQDLKGEWKAYSFESFLETDGCYPWDWELTKRLYPCFDSQTSCVIEVLAASIPTAKMEDCRKMAQFQLPMALAKEKRSLDITFSLRDQKIIVHGVDNQTKRSQQIPVNYLFNDL